ncbi:MAG TPA: SAM domain-containing protein [Stellaceae bacterium]|nr:SAM domain-containing protein [Stellaceae bacterium]
MLAATGFVGRAEHMSNSLLAWAMIGDMPMDISEWLRGLGLEQYALAFRDNDIDADVLPELTAEDLTGLGVASIGHRRKLLAAIAALRDAPAAAVPVPMSW